MIRGLWTLLSAFVVILLVPVAMTPDVHAGDSRPWVVVSLSGGAETRVLGAAWKPVQRGDFVTIGHEVRTKRASELVLVRGQDSMTIEENSQMELQPAPTDGFTRVLQKLGRVLFKVQKRRKGGFEVRSDGLVATVKGTSFTMSVEEGGGTVEVTDGRVDVGQPGSPKRVEVKAGQRAAVSADGTKVSPIPGFPTGGLPLWAVILAILSCSVGLFFFVKFALLPVLNKSDSNERELARRPVR